MIWERFKSIRTKLTIEENGEPYLDESTYATGRDQSQRKDDFSILEKLEEDQLLNKQKTPRIQCTLLVPSSEKFSSLGGDPAWFSELRLLLEPPILSFAYITIRYKKLCLCPCLALWGARCSEAILKRFPFFSLSSWGGIHVPNF